MARRLEVEIVGDASNLERSLGKTESRMGRVGKTAGIVGAAIVGGLAVGLDKSVKAAIAAQASQARLEQAFKAAHIAIGPYTDALDAAESSGRKLGFADEDTKDSLARLLTATHSVHKSISELGVAQDIARFKGVSLTDATKMLTMAQTGSQRAAKQLGIVIPTVTKAYDALGKNATIAEKAHAKLIDKMATGDATVKAVAEHVAGQGAAYSKTAAGGMAQFHAQLAHLEVSIGTALIPILTTLAEIGAKVANYFSEHATTAKILGTALAALGVTMLAISVATKIATAAQVLFNAVMDANPIMLVVLAIAALAVGVVEAYKHFRPFRDAVNEAWSILKDVFGWIKSNWPLLVGILGGPIGIAVAEIATHFNAIKGKITSALTGLGDLAWGLINNIGDAITNNLDAVLGWGEKIGGHIKGGILGFLSGIGNAVWGELDNIGGAVRSNLDKIAGWGADIGRGMKAALLDAFTGIGGAITDALKKAVDAVIRAWNALAIPGFDIGFTINTHIPGVGKIHAHVGFPEISLPDIPQLAMGGTLFSGQAAIVGERGPELFVPNQAGTVMPNAGTGAAPSVIRVPLVVDGSVLAELLIDPLRNQAQLIKQRTGKPAFG